MQHSPGFLKLVEGIRGGINETNAAMVKARLEAEEAFTLIDVREESEWAAGHLPKAIHLSKGIIERDIEGRIPDKNADIVLYCGGGFRSALAAHNLQQMGYTNISSMDGGYRAWTENNFPIAGK